MTPGETMAMLARPALSGSLRARQAHKEGIGVTKRQWLGYVAVAAFTTWLTQRLDDLVEEHLADRTD
ncbi:MAG TPA: hypothetical protein VLB81_14705 [Gaiellales bacterium]|nr:hypothetical protein [Gaiellales bacterium]